MRWPWVSYKIYKKVLDLWEVEAALSEDLNAKLEFCKRLLVESREESAILKSRGFNITINVDRDIANISVGITQGAVLCVAGWT